MFLKITKFLLGIPLGMALGGTVGARYLNYVTGPSAPIHYVSGGLLEAVNNT